MSPDVMLPPTYFLPAVPADAERVACQREALLALPELVGLLNAAGIAMVVLNLDRQVVLANAEMEAFCGLDGAALVGRRLGDVLGCAHAHEPPAGCGTTPSCTLCGAAQVQRAVLQSQRHKVSDCRITRADGEALVIRVTGGPMQTAAGHFIVLSLLDKSDAHRRETLERLFFHDVLNAAGALKGLIDAWPELSRSDVLELAGHAQQLASQVVEEIAAQRDLRLAEYGTLTPRCENVGVRRIVDGIVHSYERHVAASGKRLHAHHGTTRALHTDPVLLRRVLGNLVLNALEASRPGGSVTIRTRETAGAVAIEVHNAGVIPRRIELQIFQRAFTTSNDPGRGLGTYSVKLLTERYLGGRVTLTTSDEEGTTFRVELPAIS